MESCSEFYNKRGSTRFRVGIPAHFSTCWRLNVCFLMIFRPTSINLLLRTPNWYSSRLPPLLIQAEKKHIKTPVATGIILGDYYASSATFCYRVVVFFPLFLNLYGVFRSRGHLLIASHFKKGTGRSIKCDTVWQDEKVGGGGQHI